MIFPSKYISVGGYGLLFSALSISLIMFSGADALKEWVFWLMLTLALGCIGYWIKEQVDKKTVERVFRWLKLNKLPTVNTCFWMFCMSALGTIRTDEAKHQ